MMRLLAIALALAFAATGAGRAEETPQAKSEWLPGAYTAWSTGKRHALIAREDGVTEFRHLGKGEWTLNGFPQIPVKPGEAFTFSCRSERVTDGAATRRFNLEAVLYDARGEVLSWHWGRVSIQPGDAGETTFLVPLGVASLRPRFSGVGNFAGAFPQAMFARAEDVDDVTRETNLAPLLAVASPTLAVSLATSNGVFSVTDRRTGRALSLIHI